MDGHRWQIYPLNLGEFVAIERSIFVLHSGFGTKIKAPCLGWLLHDGSEWVLVDTGPWDPARAEEYHAYEMVGSGPEAVRRGLKDHGLEPEDIEHVLLTHLHWDHVANVGMFEKARFYVQHAEACYALDPLPPHRRIYEVGQGGTRCRGTGSFTARPSFAANRNLGLASRVTYSPGTHQALRGS